MENNLKFLDELILSYAQSYEDVDYHALSNYMSMPKTFIAKRTQKLIDWGFLICKAGKCVLSEEAEKMGIVRWENIRDIIDEKNDLEEKEEFVWDEAYIPYGFKNE